jgi:branched-chain amino acid transport system permease protein
MGTLFGPLLGAIVVPWITQYLQFLQEYRFVVFGPLLILLVIFLPNGLVGLYLSRRTRRLARAGHTGRNGASASSDTNGAGLPASSTSLPTADHGRSNPEKGHA